MLNTDRATPSQGRKPFLTTNPQKGFRNENQ